MGAANTVFDFTLVVDYLPEWYDTCLAQRLPGIRVNDVTQKNKTLPFGVLARKAAFSGTTFEQNVELVKRYTSIRKSKVLTVYMFRMRAEG